jgi:hypothetical protein
MCTLVKVARSNYLYRPALSEMIQSMHCFPHVSTKPTLNYKWVSIVVAQNVEPLSCLLLNVHMYSCKSDISLGGGGCGNAELIVIYSFAVAAGYLNVKDV